MVRAYLEVLAGNAQRAKKRGTADPERRRFVLLLGALRALLWPAARTLDDMRDHQLEAGRVRCDYC